MSDDDLIRRGDAVKAMADYHWNRYASRAEGGTLSSPAVFTSHTWQDVQNAIRAIPATDAPQIVSQKHPLEAEARRALENDVVLGWISSLPMPKVASSTDARPAWLSNCVVCGRVVDTREKDEGGDGHGCEYAEGWTCSSECAEKLHPDPEWMTEGLATDARADALREAADLFQLHPWSWNAKEIRAKILALIDKPAPDAREAAQAMLELHDGFMAGKEVDTAAADRLHLAASFGAQAFTVCPMPEARPSAMLRAFLLALIDPMHPDLEYLRAKNVARLIGGQITPPGGL